MPSRITILMAIGIFAASHIQANAQVRSTQAIIEELKAFIKSKEGKIVGERGLMGLRRSERNTLTLAKEIDGVLKDEIPKTDLTRSGHLFDTKGSIGKIVNAADDRIVEAQPGIVEGIQKLEQPVSEQKVDEIVQAELLKTKSAKPYVKFDVLSGKLSIDGSIDKSWGSLAFGDVNLYKVTTTISGAIAVCYELGRNTADATLKAMIERCVANAIEEFRMMVVREMFKNASANQVRALLEDYSD